MSPTLLLTRSHVRTLLSMSRCIQAVEDVFRQHAEGSTIKPGILGVHVNGGGFHVKTAGMTAQRSVLAVKVNANFPANPEQRGFPTIQGIVALFDAVDGRVLALLDSAEITSLRTAAATAVAAKYLALSNSHKVSICGCGEQGRSQLRALACVRPVTRVIAMDRDAARARRYASEMSVALGIDVVPVAKLTPEARDSDIWVTCTPARRWFLGCDHVRPGAFVAAVGADNPEKQEIDPALMAASAVIVDVMEQCATIGDLHHALLAGAMRREDVRAELADVVAGRRRGRESDDEIIVFDSTGTALEDVAATHVVYEEALMCGAGIPVDLAHVSSGAES